jgi:hypothetical protein
VATEPTLHGSGIGRTLMTALDGLRAKHVDSVVLECLTSREACYQHFGFRRLDELDDPGRPGLRAVLVKTDIVGHEPPTNAPQLPSHRSAPPSDLRNRFGADGPCSLTQTTEAANPCGPAAATLVEQ